MRTGKRNKQAVKLHCATYAKRLRSGELIDQQLYDRLVTEVDQLKCASVNDWTPQEQSDFLDHLAKHGRNFKIISELVGTRNYAACRWFGEKLRNKLEKGQYPSALDPSLKGKMTPDLVYRLLFEKTKERNREIDPK